MVTLKIRPRTSQRRFVTDTKTGVTRARYRKAIQVLFQHIMFVLLYLKRRLTSYFLSIFTQARAARNRCSFSFHALPCYRESRFPDRVGNLHRLTSDTGDSFLTEISPHQKENAFFSFFFPVTIYSRLSRESLSVGCYYRNDPVSESLVICSCSLTLEEIMR